MADQSSKIATIMIGSRAKDSNFHTDTVSIVAKTMQRTFSIKNTVLVSFTNKGISARH